MGYNTWDTDFYNDRETTREKEGKDAFVHHAAMMSTPADERKCHPEMDPNGITRESRDSEEHPESVAVAIVIDQTGSMRNTPIVMQQALPELMNQLVENGCLHPQVLFSAVGDESNREKASLQIGQFESGIETDDDLGRIYMEGMGGGSGEESYQNAIYFFARHTSIDCHEKRGEKGYLFLVGDEMPYPFVYKNEIEALFGDTVQADIPIEVIIKEAQEKYNIYFVIPGGSAHAGNSNLSDCWAGLLGEDHIIQLPDASGICGAVTAAVTGNTQMTDASTPNVRV